MLIPVLLINKGKSMIWGHSAQQDNVGRVSYVQVNGNAIENNDLEIATCVTSEKIERIY